MNDRAARTWLTVPNLLTGFRFFSAPLLLWLAWHGLGTWFLLLLALTFATDVLDGFAARLLAQESEFGALLDSWGDICIYTTMAISAWWLWPEVVRRERIWVLCIVASYLVPVLVGIVKFHAFTSYHTWMVKIAVAAVGLSFFGLFLLGYAWPFRAAALLSLLAAGEETAITLYLRTPRSNVRSLWHVLRRPAG